MGQVIYNACRSDYMKSTDQDFLKTSQYMVELIVTDLDDLTE